MRRIGKALCTVNISGCIYTKRVLLQLWICVEEPRTAAHSLCNWCKVDLCCECESNGWNCSSSPPECICKTAKRLSFAITGPVFAIVRIIWHVNDPLHIEANACVHRAMARRNGQADLHVFYSVLSMIMAFEWGHVGCVHLNELGKRQIIVLFVRYTRTSYLVHIWVSGYCV